jgi:hypothetical protein
MNEKALSSILNDKKHITYWHIEAISKGVFLPSCALLALSRVYSLVRDGKLDTANAFICGLRSFVDHLETVVNLQAFSKENVDGMIKSFEEVNRLEGPVASSDEQVRSCDK